MASGDTARRETEAEALGVVESQDLSPQQQQQQNAPDDADIRQFFLLDADLAVTQAEVDAVKFGIEQDFRHQKDWAEEEEIALESVVDEADNVNDNDECLLPTIVDKARDYQIQFFEHAKLRNTIVYLNTGMGKTLIAILLIKHYLKPEFDNNKMILFLVPSNALAIQQSDTLRANLPEDCSVEMASCQISFVESRGHALQEEVKKLKCKVLVATHGAMLALFHTYKDYFNMANVKLLILDECHNCTGNSPYAQFMKGEYFLCPKDHRPRVLGLTASPLIHYKNPAECEMQLRDLMSTMDSRIVSIHSLNGIEDAHCLHQDVTIRQVKYADHMRRLPPGYPSQDSRMLKSRKKEFDQLDDAFLNLGPYPISLYCPILIRDLKRNSYEGESDDQYQLVREYLNKLLTYSVEKSRNDGCSDKLIALEEYLFRAFFENPETVSIIFVKMRVTALVIHNYFKEKTKARPPNHRNEVPQKEIQVGRKGADDDATSDSSITIPSGLHSGNPDQTSHDIATIAEDSVLEKPLSSNEPISGQFSDANSSVDETKRFVTMSLESESGLHSGNPDQTPHNIATIAEDPGLEKPLSSNKTISGQFSGTKSNVDKTKRFVAMDFDSEPMSNEIVQPLMTASSEQTRRCHFSESNLLIEHDAAIPMEIPVRQPEWSNLKVEFLVACSSNLYKRAQKAASRNDEEFSYLIKEMEHNVSCTREVLRKLRNGQVNVLIATSVVEEGVDVVACSFVAAFDPIYTMKSFVQMRGRARQRNATFLVFESGDGDDSRSVRTSLKELQSKEKGIIEVLSYRATEQQTNASLTDATENCEHSTVENESTANGFFSTELGKVTLGTAVSLLHCFLESHVKNYDPTALLKRDSLNSYKYRVSNCFNRLSLPSYIQRCNREVVLPKHLHSKFQNEKYRLLALIACVRLYHMGLLSYRLQPISSKDLTPVLNILPLLCATIDESNKKFLETIDAQHISRTLEASREMSVYRILQVSPEFCQFQKVLSPSRSFDLAIVTPQNSLLSSIAFMENHRDLGNVELRLERAGSRCFTGEELEILSKFSITVGNARWMLKTHADYDPADSANIISSILRPYLLCCISECCRKEPSPKGESTQLDCEPLWSYMNQSINESLRSREDRIRAIQNLPIQSDGLSDPRLWSSIHDPDQIFIVYGASPCGCNENFGRDNEENSLIENSSVPSFEAQKLWHLPDRRCSDELHEEPHTEVRESGMYCTCKGLPFILLSQSCCLEAPMASPSLLLTTTFLPHVLNKVRLHLRVSDFLQVCATHFPATSTLLHDLVAIEEVIALLSKNVRAEQNIEFEKLEWLGSGVFDLMLSSYLMLSTCFRAYDGNMHDGMLNMLRTEMRSSARLQSLCQHARIDQFLCTESENDVFWTRRYFEYILQGEEPIIREDLVTQEHCAAFVQALMGLAYCRQGYSLALKIAAELKLIPDYCNECITLPSLETHAMSQETMDRMNSCTSCSFASHALLLQEALTHPTAIDPDTPSCERLQWIGTAVLTLSVREWILNTFHPCAAAAAATTTTSTACVPTMRLIENALIGHETLAFFALRTGMYEYIVHTDPTLPGQIEAYRRSVRDKRNGLFGTDPPQAMAHVIQSMVGAAYMRRCGDDDHHHHLEDGRNVVVLHLLKPALDLFQSHYSSRGDSELAKIFRNPQSTLMNRGGNNKMITLSVIEDLRTDPRRRSHRLIWRLCTRNNNHLQKAAASDDSFPINNNNDHCEELSLRDDRYAITVTVKLSTATKGGRHLKLLTISASSVEPAKKKASQLFLWVLEQNPDLARELFGGSGVT